MPTLTTRSSSSSVSDGPPHPRAFAPPTLSALVAQAAAADQLRSRFTRPGPGATAAGTTAGTTAPQAVLSPGSSVAMDDLALDDDDDNMSSVSSAAPSLSPQEQLEAEFAAAVGFVDSYQGPHRILKQENSTPKKEFYALYQQATVGACPLTSTPVGLSAVELARWEKWRALGYTPRHEAMRKYTATLDNLVDDWRRTAGFTKHSATANLSASMTSTTSSIGGGGGGGGGSVASPSPSYQQQRQPVKKSTSMFDRLPRIFDEFAELQERLDDETRKREELETQLVAFTRDSRALFAHELHQADAMRTNLTQLVKSLEEDVAMHYTQAQQALDKQQQLQALVDASIVLRVESRVRHVFAIITSWVANKMFRRVLLVLVAIRVWRFARQRKLPQFVAQLLIRWLATASSLDNPTTRSSPAVTVVRR